MKRERVMATAALVVAVLVAGLAGWQRAKAVPTVYGGACNVCKCRELHEWNVQPAGGWGKAYSFTIGGGPVTQAIENIGTPNACGKAPTYTNYQVVDWWDSDEFDYPCNSNLGGVPPGPPWRWEVTNTNMTKRGTDWRRHCTP